jgi:hypothetical protein
MARWIERAYVGIRPAFRRRIIRTCRSGRPGKRIARRLRRVGCLGHLSTQKGSSEARKDRKRSYEFPTNERNWIEQTTKRLIRRAAEVAHDLAATTPLVTMGDLPKLR